MPRCAFRRAALSAALPLVARSGARSTSRGGWGFGVSVPLWRLLGVAALVSRDALSTREGADGSVYGHTTPYYDEFGRLVLSETSATLPASHPTGYEFGGDSNGAQAFTQGRKVILSSASFICALIRAFSFSTCTPTSTTLIAT